jgi:hypothetical protein
MKKTLIIIGLLGAFALNAAERYVPEYLKQISVTVRADGSEGSGSLFVRKVDGKDRVFCWSAGHVVASLRREEERLKDGKPNKIITFDDPKLVRELRNADGRRTGEVIVDARVIRYSPANKNDLVLLMALSEDFKAEATTEFYSATAKLHRIGTHQHHMGSFLGSSGAASYSDGVISAHGRILFKVDFCQTSCVAYPGSSGGPVVDDDGKYTGMLVRGAGSDYNLTVPVRRMWKWTKDNGILWSMDASKPITMKEIDALDVEGPSESGGAGNGYHKEFPFQLRVRKAGGLVRKAGGEIQ